MDVPLLEDHVGIHLTDLPGYGDADDPISLEAIDIVDVSPRAVAVLHC